MSWFKGFDSPTPKKRHICPEYKPLIMLWSWCVPLLQLVNRGPSKHGAMGLIMPKIRIQPFLHSQTSDFNAWDPIWVISVLWLLSRLLTFLLGLEIVKIIIKKHQPQMGLILVLYDSYCTLLRECMNPSLILACIHLSSNLSWHQASTQ